MEPKSHSKVVKGVMPRSISIGESTEITESAVKMQSIFLRLSRKCQFELSCKFSFRRSITKINKEEGFKKALRIKSLSSTLRVFVFAKFIDERKIDALKDYFKRVIFRNHIWYYRVSKRRLNSFSHVFTYNVDKYKIY